ncbi:Fc.00g006790.m01.CDS01 [Cosmosporella sp. VM-42]
MSSSSASGATAAGSLSRDDATPLLRQVNRLLNRQLSSVCQVNGLKSTGVKADMQNRIAHHIQEVIRRNDVVQFQQIRHSVQNAIANTSTSSSPARVSQAPYPVHSPHLPPPMAFPHTGTADVSNGHRPLAYAQALQLTFKTSPFYQVESTVSDVKTCEAMSQHRSSVTIPLKLTDQPGLQRCVNDESCRVMVFCAADGTGIQDISFPHQSELRVNGGEIKANLRGLKNKPGSTRPVDITSALRLRPNYVNNLEFTYALTNKAGGHHKYFLVLNLCKVVSADDLTERIKVGKKIPKDSVVRELNKKAQDPDVVATSQVLSLKCPLTYMRLSVPCRGLTCSHIQCFDATSYLQLQEQGPQWLCPICNKFTPFDQLAVDEYVKNILDKTSKSLESVTIEPDGRWLVKSAEDERHSHSQTNGTSLNDDDDDDWEISEVSVVNGRRFETPKNPTPSTSTPVSASRDSASLGPRGIATTSAKRPAPVVIDLTSSDDEEPISRPTKRQNTSNGYNGPSHHLDFMNQPTHDYS